jgi:polar amino acid transport system substrate-binding protein
MTDGLSPDLVRELAPAGRLRAAINFGNSVLAQPDPAGGPPRGVSGELARELAQRLGVGIDYVIFDAAGKVFEALKDNLWDVAFLAVDPVRAAGIAFTAPYVVIEGVYLVPKDSGLQTVEDIDRDGVRVAVAKGSAYDLYLSRALKRATLVRRPSGPEALEIFMRDRLEAAGGVRQPIDAFAQEHPDTRVIPGRFMTIEQAMGTVKGRQAGLAYLRTFIVEM